MPVLTPVLTCVSNRVLQCAQTVLHIAVQSSAPSSDELVTYLLHAHAANLLELTDDTVSPPPAGPRAPTHLVARLRSPTPDTPRLLPPTRPSA